MRRLLLALFVLSLAAPCRAAEEAKHNTLTPKEIAEGWILLFDGETTFGWWDAEKIGAKAEKGSLVVGQEREWVIAAPRTPFLNFELSFDYRVLKGNDRKFFRFWFWCDGAPITEKDFPVPADHDWRMVHCVRESRNFSCSIRTTERELDKWSERHNGLPILLGWFVGKGGQVALRNIKLKPLKMKPIFNGKDLSGWKKFEADPKRAKSQFTVTREGWLSIKNGPGDLQTKGEWADFVLQLDCRTNGDNLNSGIFFRCIPGQYQNGYEAQIQNQKAKEPKIYTVEEYDAKTNELTGKKKIENWSQDYGTGAIYRRIPARRSVAKDREWFTMTVVARGRHFATWVNGIQTVDWTDNRPEKDNARNGCRLKKGPISLQGHDPTTDLSFRNFRLADLEAKD